jgi:hypothetical protein
MCNTNFIKKKVDVIISSTVFSKNVNDSTQEGFLLEIYFGNKVKQNNEECLVRKIAFLNSRL